jgi:chromosomal replication initiator protein
LLAVVSRYFGVPVEAILDGNRQAPVTEARYVCAYLAKTVLGHSSTFSAERVGYLDHSSALYAVRQVRGRMEKDLTFRMEVEFLTDALLNSAEVVA